MNDRKLLSEKNLKALFERFNGAEAKVVDYLDSHCNGVSTSDIQGIVGAYEETHSVPNFHVGY